MQYIKRSTITMATLMSALSSISPHSVHTVDTSFGVCLVTRATGARYVIKDTKFLFFIS